LLLDLADLPITFPLPADWMPQRQPEGPLGQRAVVQPAVILKPCRMRGILEEVVRADVVVLPSTIRRRRAKKLSAWLVQALSLL